MKTYRPGALRILTLVLSTVVTLSPLVVQAQTFTILDSFTGGPDGGNPSGGMVFDADGNLYGTTLGGGHAGCSNGTCGVAFQLSPGSGGWSETVLYTFTGGSDGGNPIGGMIFDAAGSLYGTAEVGGVSCGHSFGCGVAFELSPDSGGWTQTVLHSFQGGTDGYYPVAALAFDTQGHLYSTLANGGSYGSGAVYELTNGTGGWKEVILHSFNGWEPEAAVILDAAGNLYSTAPAGGSVWELLHGSSKEKTLYQFKCGSDGCKAWGGLVFDKAGNLYGTTEGGGRYNKGTVFKLSPSRWGKWKETVLHNFRGRSDGDEPLSTPVLDKKGNLYGTTYLGGDPTCNCGTVFKLTPGSGGRWKETVLHRFTGGSDGSVPESGLTIDAVGDHLYGTTFFGGNAGCYNNGGCGVVFEITP
jgi:uncharacterized repeat protein (TIGR03803 family)